MENLSTPKLWALLIPYSMFLSTLYQMGLWGHFDINVFSFMTPNQLLMSTLISIMATALSSIAGLIIGNGMASMHLGLEKKKPIASKGLEWTLNGLLFFCAAISFIFLNYLFWFFAAPLVLMYFLKRKSGKLALEWFFKNFKGYAVILFMIISLLPFISYSRGSTEGVFIKKGYIFNPIGENSCDKGLIGKAGDFIFFYDFKSESVGLIGLDEASKIRVYPKKQWECNKESFWSQLPFSESFAATPSDM